MSDINTNNSDRSIPAVGQNGSFGDKKFIVIMVCFFVFALFLLWFLSSSKKEDPTLSNQMNSAFDREKVPMFDFPDNQGKLESKQPESIEESPSFMSAEEKRRLQAEADLLERRKRAPVVIFDGISQKNLDIKQEISQTKKSLLKRQEEIKNRLGYLDDNTFSDSESDTNNASIDRQLSNGDFASVSARLIDRSQQPYIIAQGKMIGATLETAIQSDLPGMVRAIVSEDVYSFDGRLKLIEKGSRLIGEYQSGVRRGQVRVFVSWNRVITPNGVDVSLESPSTDGLGRSGISGWADRHFLERFGSSILLSIIGAYSAREAAKDSSVGQEIRGEVSDDFNRLSEITLNESINIPTTIHINQGEYIKIFVARDLNFKSAYILNKRQQNYSYHEPIR